MKTLLAPSVPAGSDRDLVSRIIKTDLLKSEELPPFQSKSSFEIWAEAFKNDLYAKLPEAKHYFEIAEKCIKSTPPTVLNTEIIQNELATPTNPKFTSESASLIDSKIYSALNNLTREHPIAPSKIKLDNPEKLGMLAWYNLFASYHQDSPEHKTNCLEFAMTVKHCTNLSDLSNTLDRWLLACAKTEKYENPLSSMQKLVY